MSCPHGVWHEEDCEVCMAGAHLHRDGENAANSETDLPTRLKATGMPECAEYEEWVHRELNLYAGNDCPVVPRKKADAMATALLDHFEEVLDELKDAEAEVANVTEKWHGVIESERATARLNVQLKAEGARLKWMLGRAIVTATMRNDWGSKSLAEVKADLAARYEAGGEDE